MQKGHRNITVLYDIYCKNTVPGLQVPKEQFKNILKKFSVLLTDKVLDAEEVKLPIIGTLRVKKVKQSYLPTKMKIDYQATKLAGKKVYHLNDDRNGHFYRFSWKKSRITNIRYYSFVPERWHLKRRLCHLLKTEMSKDFFTN